jgi:hypothetical protein
VIASAHHTERLGCNVSPRDLSRFLAFVKVDPESGCWEWIGHTSKKGYAQFWWAGRAWWAHRWSFALLAGEIHDAMTVHHECHNPACVNPAHLSLTERSDNTAEGNTRRTEDIPF